MSDSPTTIEEQRIFLQQLECDLQSLELATDVRDKTVVAIVKDELSLIRRQIFDEDCWRENSEKLKELETRFAALEERQKAKK